MSPETYAKLLDDFPNQLAGIRMPCECGDGWEPVIRWALGRVDRYGLPVSFDCIKEKFGGLRMYWVSTNGEGLTEFHQMILDAVIRVAETEASITCETCGERGKLRDRHGWLSTLCDLHAGKETK